MFEPSWAADYAIPTVRTSTSCDPVVIGKLASLLAVTVTPQKDINVRPPVGGPCLLGGGLALYLVFPLFVFVGSVSIVPCTSYHHHHPHHRARGPGQTIVLPAVAGPACCVHQGGARLSHHVPLYSKAPPRVAAKPSVSAGASRASPFHLAVHAAFVVTRLVTAAPPSRSQSLRFRIHQRSARAILRMLCLATWTAAPGRMRFPSCSRPCVRDRIA